MHYELRIECSTCVIISDTMSSIYHSVQCRHLKLTEHAILFRHHLSMRGKMQGRQAAYFCCSILAMYQHWWLRKTSGAVARTFVYVSDTWAINTFKRTMTTMKRKARYRITLRALKRRNWWLQSSLQVVTSLGMRAVYTSTGVCVLYRAIHYLRPPPLLKYVRTLPDSSRDLNPV